MGEFEVQIENGKALLTRKGKSPGFKPGVVSEVPVVVEPDPATVDPDDAKPAERPSRAAKSSE